jgi:hypothetical protein
MLMHKFGRLAAAILALTLVIAATVLIVKRSFTADSIGIKGDRLEVVAQDCPQVGWPYGCDWQLNAPPESRAHLRIRHRAKRQQCRAFGYC